MNTYRIPNLARACRVLRLFAGSDERLTSSSVAQRLGVPRTTALRILHTFCEEGLLVRQDRVFHAGAELLRLGLRALGAVRVRELAVPVLKALSIATGETVHLALLAGDKSLIAEVCDSPHPVRVASRPGTLVDLHASATGKVFLAFALRAELRRVLTGLDLAARTPRTLTTRAALEVECDRVLRLGYAIDDEGYFPGVRCVAAPVWDASSAVAAAIGVTGSAVSVPRRRIPAMGREVMAAAAKLSTGLGHGAVAAAG